MYVNVPPELSAETTLILNRKLKIFEDLTSEYPVSIGKEVSVKERNVNSLYQSHLIYGEVDFLSLGETLEIIKAIHGDIPKGGVFYDLGSGTGKGVFSAALLHEFDRCVGIEILKGLFELSLAIKLRYEITRLCILDEHKDIWSSLPDVDLVHGDIFVNG